MCAKYISFLKKLEAHFLQNIRRNSHLEHTDFDGIQVSPYTHYLLSYTSIPYCEFFERFKNKIQVPKC